MPFNAHLRLLDGLADHAVLDGFVFGEAGGFHQALDIVVGEALHQVVVQAEVKAGFAGVALPAGAPAQLIVDAARFVALCAQHEEPAGLQDGLSVAQDLLFGFSLRLLPLGVAGGGEVNALAAQGSARQAFRVAAQQDVDAAARHVGGNSYRARSARLRDDLGFLFVLLGVEHLMLDAGLVQVLTQPLGGLDGDRANQDGLFALIVLLDGVDNGIPFGSLVDIDEVVFVSADDGLVRGDWHDIQLVSLLEFFGFGEGGASHARQLVIHAEEILESDGRHGDVLTADLHAFLGFNGLMQPFREAASRA